jgi:rod shape-determining protein MreC
VGTGDTASLALPYLPANADVKTGDVLMTSGLGGVFPAGYPVGRVVEVHRDAVQPLAQVRAVPFASMNIDREVMLVWFREGHPAAPVAAASGDARGGSAGMQPQPAPPRPKPAPATATPGQPAGQSSKGGTAAPQPSSAPSPGDAAASPVKAPTPKPATTAVPEPKDAEEGPPIEEDMSPKPEPEPKAPPPQTATPHQPSAATLLAQASPTPPTARLQ